MLVAFFVLALTGVFDGTQQQNTKSTTYVGSSSVMQVTADGQSFMFALDSSNFQTSQTSSSSVIASIVQVVNGSVVGSPIATQKCTTSHFQSISGIDTIFASRGMQNWDCLPLNTVIQVDIEKSQSTGIKIVLLCTACSTSTIIRSSLHFLTPVNVESQSTPLNYGISSNNYVLLESNAKSYLYIDLS